MPAAWHQIWGSQIVTFRGFRWRWYRSHRRGNGTGTGKRPEGIAPRQTPPSEGLRLARFSGALGGPLRPRGAESGSFTDTLTY